MTYKLPPVASIEGAEIASPGPGVAREDAMLLRFRDLDGRTCELRLGRGDAVQLSRIMVRLLATTGTPLPTRAGLGMPG